MTLPSPMYGPIGLWTIPCDPPDTLRVMVKGEGDRRRILIVDDDPLIRDVVRAVLEDQSFELSEAVDGLEAVQVAVEHRPDIVLLDVMMPRMNGYDVCRHLRRDPNTAGTIVVMLSALDTVAAKDEGLSAGADSYLVKPFSPLELLATVSEIVTRRGGEMPKPQRRDRPQVGAIRATADRAGSPSEKRMREQLMAFAKDLSQMYRRERDHVQETETMLADLEDSDLATVRTLAFVVEAKDPHVRSHLDRSMRYATAVAAKVSRKLAEDRTIQYGFLLHDIGKVGIPERILSKPGPLSHAEWDVMRTHPVIGGQIVAPIKGLARAVPVIEAHHERWDGKGYPRGLAGEDIPLGARIFAIADTFDAMTSDRPYRQAQSFDYAVDEIELRAGSQFDPNVVEAFLAVAGEWREEKQDFAAHRATH
jgi:cyclic di-GMP phosphodiesterase